MTKAYVISEVRARDPEAMERYRALAAASIAAHGGRYRVRGAVPVALEGPAPGAEDRVVVVEFPSVATARAWYASPEYAPALAVARGGALERRLTLVEGVAPPADTAPRAAG